RIHALPSFPTRRSSDLSAARIYAIGDCVSFPYARWNRRLRLESVQNANDQARTLAALLAGQQPAPYAALPWFWSDLGSLRLQMRSEEHTSELQSRENLV